MANKLTKEKIDLLIEQVLNEDDGLKGYNFHNKPPKRTVFGKEPNTLKYVAGTQHSDGVTGIRDVNSLKIISKAADEAPNPAATLNLEDVKQFL